MHKRIDATKANEIITKIKEYIGFLDALDDKQLFEHRNALIQRVMKSAMDGNEAKLEDIEEAAAIELIRANRAMEGEDEDAKRTAGIAVSSNDSGIVLPSS